MEIDSSSFPCDVCTNDDSHFVLFILATTQAAH